MDRSLLERFYRGEVSQEEAHQVMEWLNSCEAERDIEKQVEAYFESDNHKKVIWNSETTLRTIHSNIVNPIAKKKKPDANDLREPLGVKRRMNDKLIWKAAAIILLLLIPSVVIVTFFNAKKQEEPASLISTITKQANKGQKLSIYLSDGTKVILNSDSEIRYPTSFGNKSRVVSIEGEAFFEVTKDASRPFIVQTPGFQTVVLGTSFNVSAKSNNPNNFIALKSGKVLVKPEGLESTMDKDVYLEPGEMLTINSRRKTSEVTEFNEELVFGWTRNTLSFKDESLENVFERLETWYAVEFQFNDKYVQVNENPYSGRFENESLENVLTGLGYVHDFEFSIVDKSVEIKFN